MEMDDFAEGPVGVAVAASAVVFSPQVRRALRRGLVYGVAGMLTAGDAVTGFVRGVRRTARGTMGSGAGELAEPEEEQAAKRETSRAPRRGRLANRGPGRSGAGARP
jgi:hypothetical protein